MYAHSIDLHSHLTHDGIIAAAWASSKAFSSLLVLLTNKAIHMLVPTIIPSSSRPSPREIRDYLQSFQVAQSISLPNPSLHYASVAVVGAVLVVTHSEGISVVNPSTEQWEEYQCDVLTVASLNDESCVVEMVDGQVELMIIGWEDQECR